MKKYNKTNKPLMLAGLFVFAALACAVVSVCIWRYVAAEPLWYYVPAGCSVAFFLSYIIVCAVATKKCEDGKSYFLLAWEMVLVSSILIALLPLAAIMWVIETIVESAHKAE